MREYFALCDTEDSNYVYFTGNLTMMTITDKVTAYMRQFPMLRKIVRWSGIRSQSDWLFKRSILQWITDPFYKNQLPLLWRIFASYCQILIKISKREKIIGARPLLRFIITLQRIFEPKNSSYIRFRDLEMYIDLQDPRFLALGNEINSGEIHCLLASFVHEGDTFIDIGANQGAYSLIASKLVGKSGQVVSVEPQPLLAENIYKSLAAYSQCTFHVHQMAVGNHNGTIDIIIPRSYSGTAGLYIKHSGVYSYKKLSVPIKCFDDSIEWRDLPGSVFVKLDIEGAEFAFLKGAKEMLSTLRPTLLMEINPSSQRASQTKESDLLDLLRSVGYTHYQDSTNLGVQHSIESLKTDKFKDVIFTSSG